MPSSTILTDPITEAFTRASEGIETRVIESVDKRVSEAIASIDEKLAAATTAVDLNVIVGKAKRITLKGPKHKALKTIITVAGARLPMLLVGPAGSGKTTAAEQVAEALGLEYETMSFGAQSSKSDLLGFIHANGQYVSSSFRRCYELGGIWLADELDAANANTILLLNSAIANGKCSFPTGMVPMHPDFVFIGSANTYGQGASRQYVGRNQLDASTLDRLVIVDFEHDNKLEMALAGTSENATKWLKVTRACRKYIESEGIRALVTSRATIKGIKLLDAGISFNDVLDMTILAGLPSDKQKYIKQLAVEAWSESKATEPRALQIGDTVIHDSEGTGVIKEFDGDRTILLLERDGERGTYWVNTHECKLVESIADGIAF